MEYRHIARGELFVGEPFEQVGMRVFAGLVRFLVSIFELDDIERVGNRIPELSSICKDRRGVLLISDTERLYRPRSASELGFTEGCHESQ
jgi:hypothetical protein